MGTWLEKTALKQCHVISLLNIKVEPAMYTSGGKNTPGRGTRNCETLGVGTDLVIFQKQKASVAAVQKWSQCVEWDEVRDGQGLIMCTFGLW